MMVIGIPNSPVDMKVFIHYWGREMRAYYPIKPDPDVPKSYIEVAAEPEWRPDETCSSCKRLAMCFIECWGHLAFSTEEFLFDKTIDAETFRPCVILLHTECVPWSLEVPGNCQKFVKSWAKTLTWWEDVRRG